jgi:hypothetical protein
MDGPPPLRVQARGRLPELLHAATSPPTTTSRTARASTASIFITSVDADDCLPTRELHQERR